MENNKLKDYIYFGTSTSLSAINSTTIDADKVCKI